MKLELKHLAPYLPYELKFISELDKPLDEYGKNPLWTFDGINKIFGDYCLTTTENNDAYPLRNCIPILRPLSDLTKEIMINGENFIPIDYFEIGDDYNDSVDYGQGNVKLIGLLKDMAKHNFIQISYMNYGVMIKLFEWHFDVFGLIDKGLAIDINELKK